VSAEIYLQWGRPVRKNATPILWPLDVFTVLAPQSSHHINVFQEAVLGLLATGVRDLGELASNLELDRDLIAFIISQELQPRGWVDASQRITARGLEALTGEGAASSLTVMYAFRDAISGRWLPRFARSLEEVRPTQSSPRDRPEFVDDRGTGFVRRPYRLPFRAQDLVPDLQALQMAWRDFRRDVRAAAVENEDWVTYADQSLELLDTPPKRAWAVCEIYAPEKDLHPWLVSDPWRLTPALRPLREALIPAMSKEPYLANKVIELLRQDETDLAGATPSDRLAQLDLLAKARALQEAPKLTKPEHNMMQEYLLSVIRLQESVTAAPRPYQEELKSLANQCGSLWEATLKWMLVRWRVEARDWPHHWQRRELQQLLQSLPLAKPLTQTSVDALSGQAANQVRLAGRDRDRPFKALMVAALLSTHVHMDHPLRAVSDDGLDWALMDMRNESSHATNHRLQKDEVLRLTQSALEWFRQFESDL
jgi:hypothetical protein